MGEEVTVVIFWLRQLKAHISSLPPPVPQHSWGQGPGARGRGCGHKGKRAVLPDLHCFTFSQGIFVESFESCDRVAL